MDEEKAKNNVIRLINNHTAPEVDHPKTPPKESVSSRIHFENVHLKDCHITVIHKTIVRSE